MSFNKNVNNQVKKNFSNNILAKEFIAKEYLLEELYPTARITNMGDFLCAVFQEAMDKDIMCADYEHGKANGYMTLYSPSLSRYKHYNSHENKFTTASKKLMITTDNMTEIDVTGLNQVRLSTNLHYGLKKSKRKHQKGVNKSLAYVCNIDIDFDGIYQEEDLVRLIDCFENGSILKPSIFISTGTGVHLIYRLENPINVWNNKEKQLALQALKNAICTKINSIFFAGRPFSDKISALSLDQMVRCPFSTTKIGETMDKEESMNQLVSAWDLGGSVKLEYLYSHCAQFCSRTMYYFTHKGIKELVQNTTYFERKEIYNNANDLLDVAESTLSSLIYKDKKASNPSTGFKVNKNLYLGFKKRCRNEVQVGHRYHSLCGLVSYAKKCGVSYNTLKADMEELANFWTEKDNVPVTDEDINSALTYFNMNEIITYKGEYIANHAGLAVNHCKRNGNTRVVHLSNIHNNRIKTKRNQLLASLRLLQKRGKKVQKMSIREISNETNISKSTVGRYIAEVLKLIKTNVSLSKEEVLSLRSKVREYMSLLKKQGQAYSNHLKNILSSVIEKTIKKELQVEENNPFKSPPKLIGCIKNSS